MPCAITRLSVPVYRRPLFGVLYRTPPDWRQAVAELTGVALHVFKRVDFRGGGATKLSKPFAFSAVWFAASS